ncbi:MAG: CHAT domain-containing protein [Cyanobacteria bacterium]|nr:CHAT domain-containing protein [Cyanobacteriota bacterium]
MNHWLTGKRYRWLRQGLGILLGVLLVVGVAGPIAATEPATAVITAQGSASPSALQEQAQRSYQNGQYEQARTLWESAYEGFAQQGDRPNQIAVLNALSATYQQLGTWSAAEAAIAQSFSLLDRMGGQTGQGMALRAQTLNTQGSLQLAMGDPDAAYDTWQRAEHLYRQVADESGTLGSRINQIQALQALGLYRQAYLELDEVNLQIQALPDSPLKVAGLKSLGNVFQITGNLEEAKMVLKAAIALAERIQNTGELSDTWLSLGNAYRGTNAFDDAINAYLVAANQSTSGLAEATARLNALPLLIQSEQWSALQTQLSLVAPLVSNLTPSRQGIYAQVNLAASLQELQGLSPAVQAQWGPTLRAMSSPESISQYLATAVRQSRAIPDQRAEGYALGQLGHLYEQTQQFTDALNLTEQALTLSQVVNAGDIAYRWQWQKGRLLKAQSQAALGGPERAELTRKAIVAYTAAFETLKQIRASLLTADSTVQFSFRNAVEPVYRELVDLLTADSGDAADLNQAKGVISDVNLSLARQVIEDLQLAELQNFFRSACLDIQPQQIDDVDPQAAIVYPVILPERLVVITSMPGQPLQHQSIPINEAELNRITDELHESLNPIFSNQVRLQLSHQVYDWLITPILDTLKQSDIKTLVFVLDGALRNIPMAALYDGEQYLIEQFDVALTPGLQLLAPRPLADTNLNVLLGALTESRQGFPALPGVTQEVDAIASQFPTQIFLNETFTRGNLEAGIERSGSPIVHLATHGQFSSKLEDTFLLSWDQTLHIRDFQILVRDHLPQVTQPIELLVLSACQTAEGDDRAALGLAGLAVRSGARSTLATLWSVNDRSTADLISGFYTYLNQEKGISKADALKRTQLDLLHSSNYSHPFYWAPFILVGNWL